MIYLTSENILLIGSVLVFAAILISKVGYRYGVPALLLFLLVGMGFGSDGLGLVFNNYRQAQFVGMAALSVILFSGGMETKLKEIRPVMTQGVILSTLGVLLTVIFTGFFIVGITHLRHVPLQISVIMCFLLAAVMSSTDSATVFSILRNNHSRLKENLQPMLELESGSNDPMAYVVTIVLIQAAQTLLDPATAGDIHYGALIGNALLTLTLQIVIGAAMGIAIGFGISWILGKVKLNGAPLYAILLLSAAFFTMSITGMVHGNGYLAVYMAGLVIGNRPMEYKKEISKFLDGMTWLMQIGMFLCLGLLVNPKEMLHVAPVAILICVFQMFIGRPLSIYLCLAPFRKISRKAKSYISWVGLKGAAPILFATYPVVAGIPDSDQIFNIVFCITLISMIVQGMTVTSYAKLLKLDLPEEKAPETFGIEIPEEAGKLFDHTIKASDLTAGDTLKEIKIPEGSRVVMIERAGHLIVPDGSVHLQEGDKLLMIFAASE